MSGGSGKITENVKAAAYGGEGWSPRSLSLRQEIGEVWSSCGIDTEWAPQDAEEMMAVGKLGQDMAARGINMGDILAEVQREAAGVQQ